MALPIILGVAALAVGAVGAAVTGALGLKALSDAKTAQDTANQAQATADQALQLGAQNSQQIQQLATEVNGLRQENAYLRGVMEGGGGAYAGGPGMQQPFGRGGYPVDGFQQGLNPAQALYMAGYANGYGNGFNNGAVWGAPFYRSPCDLESAFNCASPSDFLRNLEYSRSACTPAMA